MSAVLDTVRAGQARLRAREQATITYLLRRWREVEVALQAQLDAVALELQARQAAGETITQATLLRDARYRALLAQAQLALERFRDDAERRLQAEREAALRLASDVARDAIRAVYAGSGVVVPSFSVLPVEAINAMALGLATTAPLGALLESAFPTAIDGLSRALLQGLALGRNPRAIARDMADGFGLGLDRAMTIARTEVLRAYRESTRTSYQESGVVLKYKRLSAHDARVCIGCIEQDGQEYDLESDFDEHPNGRCALVPLVMDAPPPEWLSGEDWLRSQDEMTQREILGPRRFELWQSGEVPLSRMAQHTHDEEWGGAWVPTPVKDLRPSA
ncbi:MAG: hypothetical protein HY825_13535 [Acidobacteria bacterium]|nr:hypothetical protein [Acidobacteriota bacterium]